MQTVRVVLAFIDVLLAVAVFSRVGAISKDSGMPDLAVVSVGIYFVVSAIALLSLSY